MFGERERPVLPAQFALRVAILSGFALVMFSIIFFRLWYLQVLSGRQVPEAGQEQPGPRGHGAGAARARSSTATATSWSTTAPRWRSSSSPTELPGSHRKRRARVRAAGPGDRHVARSRSDKQLQPADQGRAGQPGDAASATSATTSSTTCGRTRTRYPGVTIQRVYVRNYPDGSRWRRRSRLRPRGHRAAAQGAPLPGPDPGDQVGQAGVENTYDNVLRGTNGMTRVQVDAAGQPTGGVLSQASPSRATTCPARIDGRCRRPGEAAINSFTTPGAFVAMNVQNGEILGLGSSPTLRPLRASRSR